MIGIAIAVVIGLIGAGLVVVTLSGGDDAQIEVLLAAIHLQQDRARTAERELRAYLRSHPDDAVARDLLQQTRRRLRRDRAAEPSRPPGTGARQPR